MKLVTHDPDTPQCSQVRGTIQVIVPLAELQTTLFEVTGPLMSGNWRHNSPFLLVESHFV